MKFFMDGARQLSRETYLSLSALILGGKASGSRLLFVF